MRRICVATLALTTTLAASPVIRELSQYGAQRGKSLQLVLKGSDLAGGKAITTLPGTVSRLTPGKPNELPLLVELRKDAPVGVYPLRVETDDGISNVVLFTVGDLPDVREQEADDAKLTNADMKTAEAVTVPAVINGTLPDADVDLYSFTARAGQKLVFEVEASVLASAIDPAIELLDASGKQIAKNDDAPGSGIDSRLEHTLARAGTYYVRIHDSKYSDQIQNHYRLKIGSYQFAHAMYPLGWMRGQPVTVHLVGGNLAAPVAVMPDTSATRRLVPVNVPASASLPQMFRLTDKDEVLEPEGDDRKMPVATVINGRIGAAGEVDKYKLAVKPGEEWILELTASSTGASQLDGLLTIYDNAGKKLVSRDDLGGAADPVIPFEVPKDVREVVIAVEDLLGRGGPGFAYRLEARREPADFTLQLSSPFVNVPANGTAIVNVNVQRRGYDGRVQLDIPNLPKGYRLAGGTVAPAAASQRFDDPNPRFGRNTSVLTITAEPEAPPARIELAVRGIADLPGGGRIVRYADGPGLVVTPRGLRQRALTAGWLEMRLPMSSAKALPVRLTTPVRHVRIAQGVEYPLNIKLEGSSGMGRPAGRARENIATQVGNLRINQGEPQKNPNVTQLLLNTNFATPATPWDFLPQITVDLNGKPTEVYAEIVTIDMAPGYQLWPKAREWKTAPGAPFTIAGRIHREPTFEGGLVKIEVQDLPDAVTCGAVEVAADAREFSMSCQAGAAAPKGVHEARLVSQAPETGRRTKDTYKGPEVIAKIKVE